SGRCRHLRRVSTAGPAPRDATCQHVVCGRAPVFGSERHVDRHACRADCDGRLPEHPAAAVAPASDHSADRDSACTADGVLLWRARYWCVTDSQPGNLEPSAAICGVSAGHVHWRQTEDGSARGATLDACARLARGRPDCGTERLAALADLYWIDRVLL